MLATFHTSKNELEDGSATFDVYLSDEQGQTLVAEPTTENTAEYLAEALTVLRQRFLDCGSDREVLSLAIALDNFFTIHAKKAA